MATMKTRIQHKRDTASNWSTVASTFVPKDGEIILYDTKAGDLRMKIGDGEKPLSELPFIDEIWKNLILAGVEDVDTWRTIQVDGEDVVVGNDAKKINIAANSSRVSLHSNEENDSVNIYLDAEDPRVLQQDLNTGANETNKNYPLTFSSSATAGSKTSSLYKNKHLTYNPQLNRLLIGSATIDDDNFIAPSIQLGGTVTTDSEGNIVTDDTTGTIIKVKEDGSINGNFSGSFAGDLTNAGPANGAKALVDNDGKPLQVGEDNKYPVYIVDGKPAAFSGELGEATWKGVLNETTDFENSEKLPTAKNVATYVEGKNYAFKSDLTNGSYTVKKAEEANHSQTTSGFDADALDIIKNTTVTNATNAAEATHAVEADHSEKADHALNADDALRAVDAQHANSADTATDANHATEADHADEADHALKADSTTGSLTIGDVVYNGSANKTAPNASIVAYGVTKLSSTASDAENLAATPKLVQDTADAILADFEIDYNKSVISMHIDGNEVEYQTADGKWHKITHVGKEDVTFSIGNSEFPGLTKLYATTGTWEDGTLTQKAISEELDKKVNYSDIIVTNNVLKFNGAEVN